MSNQDQPRVAKGTPRRGGQWSSKQTGEAGEADLSEPAGSPPAQHGPLTVDDAVAISFIADAAVHGRRVARRLEGGRIVTGTARSLSDERGFSADPGADIRDCYLHVTADSGFEEFWCVPELAAEVRNGTFEASLATR